MNKLIIILLFAFSCTQIERVGEENYGKKETIKIVIEADKLVVEKKKVETIYYKDVDPKTRLGEVRRVEFLLPNKFGVKYAYAIMDINNRGKMMNPEFKITISTFVSNDDNSECDWTEWYWEIPDDHLEKEKVIRLEELNGEFEKLISKIIKNSNNE